MSVVLSLAWQSMTTHIFQARDQVGCASIRFDRVWNRSLGSWETALASTFLLRVSSESFCMNGSLRSLASRSGMMQAGVRMCTLRGALGQSHYFLVASAVKFKQIQISNA